MNVLIFFLSLIQVEGKYDIFHYLSADYLGNAIDSKKLKSETTLVIFTSYTCGACIKSIDKYKLIKKKYPSVNMIAIMDHDSATISKFEKKTGIVYPFIKVSDSNLEISNKFWKRRVWPEYHIYVQGKRKKVFVSAAESTHLRLDAYLNKLVE